MGNVLDEYIAKFSMLTTEEAQIIKECTIIKKFDKGTQILKEGQFSSDGYLILEGCIREFFLKDGEEKTTAIYLEGDPVNHYNNGEASEHFLVCLEDCTVSLSNQELINKLVEKIPKIHGVIQQGAKESIKNAKLELNAFKSSSPEERYHHLMKTRPQIFGRVPLHQIASYLGIKPQSLSRLTSRILAKKKTSEKLD